MINRTVLSLTALLAIASAASAQVNLNLLTSVDLTPAMGSGIQASAVAWDGTNAWVGAYNNTGATGNTFIVPITNVLTTATIGSSFGTLSTANARGISSLSVANNVLLASWDNGAASGSSVRAFTASTSASLWDLGTSAPDTSKRGDGTAFDPGFNGTGTNAGGAAFLSIGSGRRFIVDPTLGKYINNTPATTTGNNDAIINFSPTSTTWRDLAFDPTTGDLYTRESNRIGKATRTGDNSFATNATLVASVGAAATDNQNIAFVNSASAGRFLIVNNRQSGATGQQLGSIVQAYSTTGSAIALSFTGIDAVATTGVGAYDFSYNATNNTLAMTDFSQKRLYIFSLTTGPSAPEPGTLVLGALGFGLLVARRRRA